MALQTEVWIQDIKEQLYANNEFMTRSTNHDEFVENKVVHVPQAGSAPAVVKNRSSFPATITERTDTDLIYTLDDFSTDPMRVRMIEEIQNSYNKRQSVLGHHVAELNEQMALELMFDWGAPAANVVPTSGADLAAAPVGATGTRKALTKDDIRALALKFDQDNVSRMGRYLLIESQMYEQLISDSELMRFDAFGRNNFEDGIVGQLYGFNILTRSTTLIYDVANAKKAVGAASAVDDNLSAVAWQEGSVAKALGDITIFAQENDPVNYGDVFSAQVLHKGAILRTDNKGVGAIVQVA